MAHLREVSRATGIAHEVRWRVHGRFQQRTFSVKREAERFALKVETELQDGGSTHLLVRRDETVSAVIAESLAASRASLKERTYLSYVSIYEGRILPRFGHRKVVSVTRAEVQGWVNDLHDEGLAAATVHHHYIALKKAFRYALDDRLIAHSPCDAVWLPKGDTREGFEPVFLTASQVEALAARLDIAHPYGLLVRFAAYTGLRAGEITGLRIRDLDLENGRISVRQTLQRIQGEWVVGTPKSKRSTRVVPLLDRRLVADIRNLLDEHPNSGDSEALVWPGRVPGSHRIAWDRVFDVASFRRNYMRPALADSGLPDMRFHDLRHTFASLAIAAGFAPYKTSRWLGHASVATTDLIYAHMYAIDHESVADQFETFLMGGN